MRLITLVLVLTIVTGCSGRQRGQTAPETDPWFCEMNEKGDDWDCVQDAELARSPAPKRLPHPDGPPQESVEPSASFDEEPSASLNEEPSASFDEEPSASLNEEPSASFDEEPSASFDEEPSASLNEEPSASLNSEPEDTSDLASSEVLLAASEGQPLILEPSALLDLPADLFAIQVVAMNTASQMQEFIEAHGLTEVTSVPIEHEDQLIHVLLLGVYETYPEAQRAILERPASIADTEPWIRPLGPLQEALLRGEKLAASTGQ